MPSIQRRARPSTDWAVVDYFRGVLNDPPLASFLSHIHSDHLNGLDTYKGRPYVQPYPKLSFVLPVPF